MGNRLAQVLAEIHTIYALLKSLQKFDAKTIPFIYIIRGSHHLYIEGRSNHRDILSQILNDVGMELVDILNCTLKRNEGDTLFTKRLKKKFSSLTTLNFHSFYPWLMKKNLINEMIKKAFFTTSEEFETNTKEILSEILANSTYPKPFTTEFIHINQWNIAL